MTRRILPAAALLLLSGCAAIEAVVSKPAAPTAPAPTASPAPTPSPAPAPAATAPKPAGTSQTAPLGPGVSAAEEQKLIESAQQNIGDVARTLGELEGRPMKPPQQEALRTAKTFLDQARSALDQRDYQRAANLASKARALTDDVAGAAK